MTGLAEFESLSVVLSEANALRKIANGLTQAGERESALTFWAERDWKKREVGQPVTVTLPGMELAA